MVRKKRPSKPPTAHQVDAEGSGVEIKGGHTQLTGGRGQTQGTCKLQMVRKNGEQQTYPQKSAAQQPEPGEV